MKNVLSSFMSFGNQHARTRPCVYVFSHGQNNYGYLSCLTVNYLLLHKKRIRLFIYNLRFIVLPFSYAATFVLYKQIDGDRRSHNGKKPVARAVLNCLKTDTLVGKLLLSRPRGSEY